jgi:chromate transporter
MKPVPLESLALHFGLLSLFAIGGANAVVPDMHRLAVTSYGWMNDRDFADLFAIANAAPGPNVLIVTLIGFKVAGIPGALTATLAMCGPTSALSFMVSRWWERLRGAPWRRSVQQALVPVTIGLVLASGWILSVAANRGPAGGAITAITVGALMLTRLNPLWLLGGAAALGLLGIG